MRQDEQSEYREGIVLDRPVKNGSGSFVNAGMRKVNLAMFAELIIYMWSVVFL